MYFCIDCLKCFLQDIYLCNFRLDIANLDYVELVIMIRFIKVEVDVVNLMLIV